MKLKVIFLIMLALRLTLQAETVEIVSSMYTEEILRGACLEKIRQAYDVRITDQVHRLPVTTDYDSITRYLVFNGHNHFSDLAQCPIEKMVLFIWEPVHISNKDLYTRQFSRIYTYEDDVIDNVRFFKYHFPDLMPMIKDLPAFEAKKLCTMVVRNWNAKQRGPVLEFLSKKPKGEFEFYGSPYPNIHYNKCYKGRIPGAASGKEKIDILKNYRFCICFENEVFLNGYISEKIFSCFEAGCVPVYWGAPNVEKYIPKDCFIDYREFDNLEDLYQFLKNMPESTYEAYLDAIRRFIDSEEAQVFTTEYFSEMLYDAVKQ